MNANEILRASALDILFEGRNKSYGAYELRRFYNQRLTIAVISTFLFVSLLIFLINRPFSDDKGSGGIIAPPVDLIVRDIIIYEPHIEKPKPASPSVAASRPSSGSLAHIKMVDNTVTTNALPQLPGMIAGNDPAPDPGFIPGPLSNGPVVSNIVAAAPPEEVFKPEQKDPAFPGGKNAWLQFLIRYLEAPSSLVPGERITVQVRFIVEKDGSVNTFEVVKSGGAAFDKEVIRVLKKMPRWQPAIQNGRPVSVSFTQPVTFESVEE